MDFEKMARDYVTTFRASDTGDVSVCYTMEYRLIHALRAAFDAGRKAMRTDAESACFSLMARNANYDGQFYVGDYADNMREAARAIRALPGKEGS